MKRFRALIFDVDGTLAETEEVHRRAFNETFAYFDLNWKWDFDLYRQLLRVTGGKERIRHFLDKYPDAARTMSDDEIAELHRFKNARYSKLVAAGECSLRPGVAELIRAAFDRGQILAIVTTTSRSSVDALLETALGESWINFFSVIVSGGDVERKKPAPDAYLKALDMLNLPGGECLAIEDSRNGLIAAQQARIPVLITRSIYFHDEEFGGALSIVGDLSELTNAELEADLSR